MAINTEIRELAREFAPFNSIYRETVRQLQELVGGARGEEPHALELAATVEEMRPELYQMKTDYLNLMLLAGGDAEVFKEATGVDVKKIEVEKNPDGILFLVKNDPILPDRRIYDLDCDLKGTIVVSMFLENEVLGSINTKIPGEKADGIETYLITPVIER